MKKEIIISGFGGQGVLSMGKILAYSGLMEDKEVTWMPAYHLFAYPQQVRHRRGSEPAFTREVRAEDQTWWHSHLRWFWYHQQAHP